MPDVSATAYFTMLVQCSHGKALKITVTSERHERAGAGYGNEEAVFYGNK